MRGFGSQATQCFRLPDLVIGKDECVSTSTLHQPASAGFRPGLRVNVSECG
jgi:hypothetical protein